MREDEPEQQRLLFAGRAQSGRLVLVEMRDGEVAAMRPHQRTPGGRVAVAALRQVGDKTGGAFPPLQRKARARNRLLADDGTPDATWLTALEAQMAEHGAARGGRRVRS